MIDALFNQPNFLAAQRLMDLTALRHEAISANLANIETPRYKRVDVDPAFEQQLEAAIRSRNPSRLREMNPQVIVDSSAVARRADGNTVELESELLRLNRNGVEHALETHLLTSTFLKLRHAITGRSA
jgi:flagellar basal-body rod protein FlgB